MSGFALAAQAHAIRVAAWSTILPLLTSGTVKPIVEELIRWKTQPKHFAIVVAA